MCYSTVFGRFSMSATSAVPPRKQTLEDLLTSPRVAARAMWVIIGIGAVLRLGAFAKRVLSPAAAICALLFAATSHVLIYYASEAKPYGPDGLVTLMLVLPAWIICQGSARRGTWWWLALALAVAPLLSFTAVFVVVAMIPALRAYARAASPDGPAFVNAREQIPLTVETKSALLRSTPFGVDILGTASGVYTQYRRDLDVPVFDGWGDQEVERILEHARGCVWTFESHPKPGEREALDAALGGRGFSATQSVGDTDDVRATRLCRSTS